MVVLLDFCYTGSENIVRKVFSDTEVFITIPYRIEKSQYCPTLLSNAKGYTEWGQSLYILQVQLSNIPIDVRITSTVVITIMLYNYQWEKQCHYIVVLINYINLK